MTHPTVDTILKDLYGILQDRKTADPKRSYVAHLYEKGRPAILRKVSEESFEVVMAAKDETPVEVVRETADLLFHLWILLAELNISPEAVLQELVDRFGRSGMKEVASQPPRRVSQRLRHRKPVELHLTNGLVIPGTTRDISLEGLLVEVDYEPKWQLMGEKGVFEIQVTEMFHAGGDRVNIEVSVPGWENRVVAEASASKQIYRFHFEVSRITEEGIGLRVIDNHGLFGFALSNEVFKVLY
ncbi:MAG: phosphoribosyl-ATP diphosphatase [Magnetococcales bacterium]|nr:phosphoribosyl-ATP diphosphatase [Magnetococcales bacterium]